MGIISWSSKTISPPFERRSRRPSSRLFPPREQRRRLQEDDRHTTVGKHGGRVERRSLETTSRLNAYLDWPDVAQVCRVQRTVRQGGKETQETAYAITSVPREQADAATLLSWWRGHWGIENRLHWVRDVTMGEDASRIRTGSGPQVMAGLRNAAISFLRSQKVTNIAAALRRNAARARDLLASLRILKN